MSEDPLVRGDSPRLIFGIVALVLALSPAVTAIWVNPAFLTQDGPAHLLNARILVETLSGDSPLGKFYSVRWSLLPNWVGHLTLMGLSSFLPPLAADRTMTTLTLVGLAAATFWLRVLVAGPRGAVCGGLLAAILAMNVCWLFGFWSFLVGVCLFPITLGFWWKGRSQNSLWRSLVLAILFTLGYFGHLISLGLTVVAVVVLEIFTPSDHVWKRRLWTLASFAPLVVLVPIYRSIMRRGGAISPVWGHIGSLRSQLGWVDPITLGQRDSFPFVAIESRWLAVLAPAFLLAVALLLLVVKTVPRLDRDRRGWLVVCLVFLVGGVFSPDTLGLAHGNYLPQRLVLLGLLSLVPWLDLELRRTWREGIIFGLLVAAVLIQNATVCDYARESNDRIAPFVKARNALGQNQKIATLLIGIKGRFRSNPLLHADNLLGVDTGNVVWANYETTHYYFPVQFRDGIKRPEAQVFEEVAIRDQPNEAADRASTWAKLLADSHDEIDILIVWGQDPSLQAINARWFDSKPIFEDGPLRAYRRRR